MTCGTLAHQWLTYLTFISVREVDRCSGSYGSSLSCSLHGAHSAAFGILRLWAAAAAGHSAAEQGRAGWAWMDSPCAACGAPSQAARCSRRRGPRAEPGASGDAWKPGFWEVGFPSDAPELLFSPKKTCPGISFFSFLVHSCSRYKYK